MKKYDRKANREDLQKRSEKSYETREDSGRFKNYLREDVEFPQFKCKEGEHYIDIIPYIAGKRDPLTKEGKGTYVLDLWVHRGVGPNENSYVCPARNYGDPCPICEHVKELRRKDDVDDDLLKELYPKRRVVYNVVCMDDEKEEAKGVQVWEVSHYLMEANISPLIKGGRGGGVNLFSDPDEGKSIRFEVQGSGTNTRYKGHRLDDRIYSIPGDKTKEYTISEEILKRAYCLDDLIIVLTYDELSEVYYGKNFEGNTSKEEGKVQEEKEEEQPEEKNPCPAGSSFGYDWDTLEPCGTCNKYEECGDEYDRLEAQKKEEPEKEKVQRRRRA